MLRGKPSIKKLRVWLACLSMAVYNNETVMKLGTIFPATITCSISSLCFDYGLFLYSLKSSPADKCLYPNLSFINWL